MLTSTRRDVVRIIPCEARRQLGKAVFVDVRSPSAWEASNEKIPGSLRARDTIDGIPTDSVVIAYRT
jgi:rhodanese-related sulfurtransferase